jgi:hypothetical protein
MSEEKGKYASNIGPQSMADGRAALAALIAWIGQQPIENRNEAQTRFDIIDRLIRECFGWGKSIDRRIKVEKYERGEFSDYELGLPRVAIWEAKREGIAFELPPGTARRPIQDIKSIIDRSEGARIAVEQVQQYCVARGVELAVITNGRQLVCFLASRSDGISPFDGDCFAVSDLQQLDDRFVSAWDLLSPDGIAERRYQRILKHGDELSVPPKLSSYLREYPRQRPMSDLQTNLRTLAELLLQDIGETEAEEARFYERCYCQSGALSQHSLLNRKILEARYAALAEAAGLNAIVGSASPKNSDPGSITVDVLSEAMSRRPVILIGDVGVGKTSYLKNLMYKDAKKVFENAVYVYVNLGEKGTLNPDIRNVIIKEAENQLLKRYGIDIREARFLRGTYAAEIERFKVGAYSEVFKNDPARYEERLADLLNGFVLAEPEHLRRSVEHLSKARHFQVIFVLDNADQRRDEIQQDAFLIAQELARDRQCHVFISLRPDTFYRSRSSGVLAAYPHRVFTISPPRVDEFLQKRLSYALDMAEGRLPIQRIAGIKLNIQSIAAAIKALIHTLQHNEELQEFLANVTGGNVRELLQFITAFFGTPNVNAEKIVEIVNREGVYRIPLHDVSKAALLGDYAHYSSERSLALNVFDVRSPEPREHFLALLLLCYLDFEGDHRDQSGFTSDHLIYDELMGYGFSESQVVDAVRRVLQKRLVETPHRDLGITDDLFDANEGAKYRLTARGAYHARRWIPTFAYIDAMVFDTPIFDKAFVDASLGSIESQLIRDRYRRATDFRAYLVAQWHASGVRSSYLDFPALLRRGEYSFNQAGRAAEFS